MKILQGCVRYPPAPGGAETVVKAYSEGLRDLGHDVEVITTDLYTETPFVKKEMPSEVNGINVTRHKAYTVSGEAHYVLAPGMVQSFLSKKADIIHTHSYGYFQNHAGWIRERFLYHRSCLALQHHVHRLHFCEEFLPYLDLYQAKKQNA